MRRSSHFALLLTALFFGCSNGHVEVEKTESVSQAVVAGAPDVTPKLIPMVDAYKSCADLQKIYDPKYDPAMGSTWSELSIPWYPVASGKYSDGYIEVTIANSTSKAFDWSSTKAAKAVIVKSEYSGANAYVYDAEAWKDEYLVAPYLKYIKKVSVCYEKTATAAGVKFNDLDGDGYKDAGEPGLKGWKIFVDYNGNGVLDAYEPYDVTDEYGNYEIRDIKPGTWSVLEELQPYWTCSFPKPYCSHEVTFYAGQVVYDLDFGNWEDSTKSGMKFEDLNADGVKDAGEPGLKGWTIYVDYNGNGVLDAGEPYAVTDDYGNYTIKGIQPGTFRVREVLQPYWTCSFPTTYDAYGCYHEETFTSGSEFLYNDFGNFKKGSKSGTKYEYDAYTKECKTPVASFPIYLIADLDGNGKLSAADGMPVEMYTDAYGKYAFENLMPGKYIVCEKDKSMWQQVSPMNNICYGDYGNSGYEAGGYAFTLYSGEAHKYNDFCNKKVVEEPAEEGDQGCSPGYWKNHTGSWEAAAISPNQTLGNVFVESADFGLGGVTLIDALSFKGGDGPVGAARILLRQAVAALLNASHPEVDYPRSATEVINAVNAALATGDRATILALATALDADNNLGCPLN